MKTTLYEISDAYAEFSRMIADEEITDEQAIYDTLDAISQEFDIKLENIACLYKSLGAEAVALEDEAKRLMARAKYKRNACDRIREYMRSCMTVAGKTKLDTPRAKLSFRKSTSLEITDEDKLVELLHTIGHDDLTTTETIRKFDKNAIKKLIKDGVALDGCYVDTKNNLTIA